MGCARIVEEVGELELEDGLLKGLNMARGGE
jgi:hypothetical protein